MKNPQPLRPGTVEPNRAMSDEDARALTAFLMSQKGAEKPAGSAKTAKANAHAREVTTR
jgi:cytochrome c1